MRDVITKMLNLIKWSCWEKCMAKERRVNCSPIVHFLLTRWHTSVIGTSHHYTTKITNNLPQFANNRLVELILAMKGCYTFPQTNLQFFMPLISAFLWASATAEPFISMPTTWKDIQKVWSENQPIINVEYVIKQLIETIQHYSTFNGKINQSVPNK